MSLFSKLKSLFSSESLPGEDRRAYAEARNLPELLAKLETNVTRNEVVLRQIRAAMSKLEITERATIASLKRGNIQGRGVRIALHSVNRYRKQLEALEQKADVINKNLNLNTNLIGKIETMQALELRGVPQEVIDQVILDFSENVEKYRDDIPTDSIMVKESSPVMSESERREMEALEKEVFGKAEHFSKKSTSKHPENMEALAGAKASRELEEPLGALAPGGDFEKEIQQALDNTQAALDEVERGREEDDTARRKAQRAKDRRLEEE